MGRDPKSAADHEYIVNRDPELATAWTKHKAITNYENFHNINVDMNWGHSTPIDLIANSALGIESWALHDVGLVETSAKLLEKPESSEAPRLSTPWTPYGMPGNSKI